MAHWYHYTNTGGDYSLINLDYVARITKVEHEGDFPFRIAFNFSGIASAPVGHTGYMSAGTVEQVYDTVGWKTKEGREKEWEQLVGLLCPKKNDTTEP